MARFWHGLVVALGLVLIVLGLLDYHVQVGAVVVGLVMAGALPGHLVVAALNRRRD